MIKTFSCLKFLPLEQWQQDAEQEAHIKLATSNFSMHIALLGIARWSSGSPLSALQLANEISPLPRIAWFDTANTNFETWLEAGGFTQSEPDTLAPLSAGITLN